jgi:hypothetical protein
MLLYFCHLGIGTFYILVQIVKATNNDELRRFAIFVVRFKRFEFPPGRGRVVVEVVAAFLTLVDEEGDEAVQVGHERSVRTRMKKKN